MVCIQTVGNTWLLKPCEGKRKKSEKALKGRQACDQDPRLTSTHTHAHTHKRACSPAHSAPTRWAERAVATQWSGTRGAQGGRRCTEGERRRGGGEAAGSALGGQRWCSQAYKRASCSPLSLSFLSSLILSLSVCLYRPTEVATGKLYRQVTTVPFSPLTNYGEVEAWMKLWLAN